MAQRKYQGQPFFSTRGQSFYKSADTRGSLHMQGSRQESGTTNALEIQQALKIETWGETTPQWKEIFFRRMILCEMAIQNQFNYCLMIRKLKLRVTIQNLNQFFMKLKILVFWHCWNNPLNPKGYLMGKTWWFIYHLSQTHLHFYWTPPPCLHLTRPARQYDFSLCFSFKPVGLLIYESRLFRHWRGE